MAKINQRFQGNVDRETRRLCYLNALMRRDIVRGRRPPQHVFDEVERLAQRVQRRTRARVAEIGEVPPDSDQN